MSLIQWTMLVLPIHKQSQEQYYAAHDKYVQEQVTNFSQTMRRPFAELSAQDQRVYKDLAWWWPYWEHNDVIGFLEIGLDSAGRMAGQVWLKRKHWLRGSPGRHWRAWPGNRQGPDNMLAYLEMDSEEFDRSSNAGWAQACESIRTRATKLIRGRKALRQVTIMEPRPPFSCIDFVKYATLQPKEEQ